MPLSEHMARIDFLGTGNAFMPPGRMHALALVDGCVLVDTPPTVLAQLRRCGTSPGDLRHILITHWHADHTFGFPFLLLERKYISDPDSNTVLNVHLRPEGKELLGNLCKTGFPGSLEDSLDQRVAWSESESGQLVGTDWSYERFPVRHVEQTDPHGYELIHSSGLRFLHCGDSGPCEEIDKRAARCQVVLLEMGIPDFVESPHHHTPSDVSSSPRGTLMLSFWSPTTTLAQKGRSLDSLCPNCPSLLFRLRMVTVCKSMMMARY